MQTMKAVRYLGPKQDFVLRAVAIPEPGPGQARVRIAACGMCHTELHLRDGLLDLGPRDFTVGHEIAGVIDAVGPGVPESRIGERVLVYYYEGCQDCRYCREGAEQLCPRPAAQPGFSSDGGYAEYIAVRASNCVKLPAHVGLIEAAPLGCAGSTAVHAGKMASIRPGEWVVVQGVGGVGAALLQYALAAGAQTIAIDINPERLALAKTLGANCTINAADAGESSDAAAEVEAITQGGADVVFEVVGAGPSMQAAVRMLRRRGRLVLIGYTAARLEVHPIELIVKEAVVMGSVGSTLQDLHEVVALAAQGKLRAMVDATLTLDHFADGLAMLEERRINGRAVLVMEG